MNLALSLLLAASFFVASSVDLATEFALFNEKFGKSYVTSEEHDYRLSVFKANWHRAQRIQEADPTAVHGVTRFSDLTPLEFRRMLAEGGEMQGRRVLSKADGAPVRMLEEDDGPISWIEVGPVENQGPCETHSWAFSAVATLEGAHRLVNGVLVTLSKQQIVDCHYNFQPQRGSKTCVSAGYFSTCDDGCNYKINKNVFKYIYLAGGLMSEADYPYTGNYSGSCKLRKDGIVAKITNYTRVDSSDESQIISALAKGPLSVNLDHQAMQTYVSGISCPSICTKTKHGVGVTLVGVNADYWTIKNSMGTGWGENGFMRICRGTGTCLFDSITSVVAAKSTFKEG